MADLNIRNIDSSLLAKLKSDAALSRVTLREHCIALLNGEAGVDPTPPHRRDRALAKIAAAIKDIRPKSDVAFALPAIAYTKQHDSSTCRIYRCGMCAAAKQA